MAEVEQSFFSGFERSGFELLKLKKIAIFGVGLLGGSFALALRRAYLNYYFVNLVGCFIQKISSAQKFNTLPDILNNYKNLYKVFDKSSDDLSHRYETLEIFNQKIKLVSTFNQKTQQHDSLKHLERLSTDFSRLLSKSIQNLLHDEDEDYNQLIQRQDEFALFYNDFYEKFDSFAKGLELHQFTLVEMKDDDILEIIGFGRSQNNLQQALVLGIIDEISIVKPYIIQQLDLVLFATPVGQIEFILSEIKSDLNPNCLIIDVGSTKKNVVEAVLKTCSLQEQKQFIPCHPIAGGDKSGALASSVDLFIDKNVIITPLTENIPNDIEFIQMIWQHLGSVIHIMTPDVHDSIFATVSHMPHVLAFAFINNIISQPNAEELFSFVGSGFKDFTRIASSNAEMWKDIFYANRQEILKNLDHYINELKTLKKIVSTNDEKQLLNYFEQASNTRKKLS